jgi:large exoprotein involved in heme utilization and adhesion
LLSADDKSKIISSTFGTGNAGNINISNGKLMLSNASTIQNSTLSQGNAGNIEIAATDNITLDTANSSIIIALFENSTGNGGGLKISTGSLKQYVDIRNG